MLEMDLDDEDYALMALGIMVSDGGYRPAPEPSHSPVGIDTSASTPTSASVSTEDDRSATPESVGWADSPEAPVPSTIASSEPGSMPSPIRPNRSSISKAPRGRDSLTLRHDGAMGHVVDSSAGPSLARSSTASSEAPYLTNDGPYQGPTAPSHAYQMYSQGTRPARTTSIATTATALTTRPESEYNGPRGPSHPYSMYPQIPVEEAPAQPVVPAIPVGFTTSPDPYQRRLGPEGEELAGIIGPDGHTEELPPYTRYPDEHYARKVRATGTDSEQAGESAGVAAVGVPVTTLAAIPTRSSNTISGAGGIGLAARNPEFDARSFEDAASPASRHSSRSFTNESHHEINTAAAAVSEKPQLGKWQRLAKKKACGVVPYWALGLTFTAVLIVLIIVAAVVGSLISNARHRGPPKSATATNFQDSVPTVTITFDATPIPTPSDLPALAQGTYGLPLNLNQAPNTCFNNTAQTAAWSCQIAFQQAMALNLVITRNAPQLGRDGTYDVSLLTNYTNTPNGADDDDTNLMYGASAPYITPAMNMELVNDTFDLDRGPAWFRMLPYNKTVVVAEDLLSVTAAKKVRQNPGGPPSVGNFQRKGVAQTGDKPWICTWPDTFVEMFIYAEQNSSYAAQSTATITTAPVATPTSTGTGSAAGTGTATGSTTAATSTGGTEVITMQHLSAYPRAVKVKERRVNDSPRAFCYQVEVQSDNSTMPVTDSNGNVIYLEIDEIEQSNGMDKRDGLSPRDSDGDMSDCGCMWFSS